jgi:hypothetical protein
MKLSCLSLVVGATAVVSLLANGANARLAPKTPQAQAVIREMKEKRQLKKDFMEAMAAGDRKLNAGKPRMLSRSERYQRLAEKIVEGAKSVDQRKLYSYQNYNGNYQNYNGNNNQNADAAQGDDGMQYVEYDASELGFDIANYAFKYSGCAAIKTYDENFDDTMDVATYVVFRLCPADNCNKYSMTGCGTDYGEYLVEMKTYLEAIMEYYGEKYEDYCRSCEGCDPDNMERADEELANCYAALQAEDWQTYYAANNGDMSGYRANVNANGGNYYNNNYAQANNYNANGYNNYNANSYSANSNYNNYYGNRKLSNYGYYNSNYNNYNNGNYNNNQYNNANNNAADQDGYGYFDENGVWTEVDGDAKGYWGSDGMFYAEGEVEDVDEDGYGDDECAMKYAEDTECDEDACGDYNTYCTDYDGNAAEAQASAGGFDISSYLECTEYTNAYGQMYWIAPHCASNHFTISLGVFSDNMCTTYIGHDVSLSTVLGYEVDSSEFLYFPKECISCDGAVSWTSVSVFLLSPYTFDLSDHFFALCHMF